VVCRISRRFSRSAVSRSQCHEPRRLTANVRDVDGNPFPRDEYAESLADQAIRVPAIDRLPLLSEGEAGAVAALLDELAGVYAGEGIGRFARELAVRIYDRLES
jgi:hypothetical protein